MKRRDFAAWMAALGGAGLVGCGEEKSKFVSPYTTGGEAVSRMVGGDTAGSSGSAGASGVSGGQMLAGDPTAGVVGMSGDRWVIGVDPTKAPMVFRDTAGQMAGFEIDMAAEASRRLKIPFEYKTILWG